MATRKGRVQHGGVDGGLAAALGPTHIPQGRFGDGPRSYSVLNPGYRRTTPVETTINGKRCISIDAESYLSVLEHYAACGLRFG